MCFPWKPSGELTVCNGKITIFDGKIHYKWPFSIAMLVHQRVTPDNFTETYRENSGDSYGDRLRYCNLDVMGTLLVSSNMASWETTELNKWRCLAGKIMEHH